MIFLTELSIIREKIFPGGKVQISEYPGLCFLLGKPKTLSRIGEGLSKIE
jgi:hypothetical protein